MSDETGNRTGQHELKSSIKCRSHKHEVLLAHKRACVLQSKLWTLGTEFGICCSTYRIYQVVYAVVWLQFVEVSHNTRCLAIPTSTLVWRINRWRLSSSCLKGRMFSCGSLSAMARPYATLLLFVFDVKLGRTNPPLVDRSVVLVISPLVSDSTRILLSVSFIRIFIELYNCFMVCFTVEFTIATDTPIFNQYQAVFFTHRYN